MMKARGIRTLAIVAIIVVVIAVAAVVSYILLKGEEVAYTLSTSVSPSGGGSVSPSSGTYNEGESVTLMATPASGYQFDYWGGDASGSSNPVTVTMDSDKSTVAYFTAPPKPGNWTASTGISNFTFAFTVNPDSTGISIIEYEITNLTYSSERGSVTTTITGGSWVRTPPWSITDGQLTIDWTERMQYMDDWYIVVEGSFDETGTYASGTWEISIGETECQTGTWEAWAP